MKKSAILLLCLAVSMATQAENITFADPHVKAVCVEHWDTDGDGELSTNEAAAVTSLGYCFSRDTGITSFDELQYFTGLVWIASSDFNDCENLTSIHLPLQIVKIGDNAFRDCYKLTAIDIPSAVTAISENAFNGCFRLATVTLHEGLTTIGMQAFMSCRALLSIDIPTTVTSIASNAFQGCTSVASITVAPGNTVYDSREDCNAVILTAKNKMVLGCQNTTFPESVTTIGVAAFSGCTKLQRLDIPEGVTAIEQSAFSSCSGLTSVVLPSSLTTIGNNAFSGCRKLTDLRLSEGLKTIDASAFEQCRSLARITIPSTVTTLSNNVFYECPKLVEVTVKFSTPLTIYSSTFSNSSNATLYVPVGCVQAFEEADYWKNFWYIYEIPILGDVNHDGFVNIYDVTLMIDYILGLDPENFHITEADINDDTFINIYDVTLLIDIILNKE